MTNLRQTLQEIAKRESWTRDQMESFQLERLNDQWSHARAHVPYYRELAARTDLPPRFDSLNEFQQMVPILSRTIMQHHTHELLSERPATGRWAASSGSTGTPVAVYRERQAEFESKALHHRMFQIWGVEPGSRSVWLWGRRATFQPGWRGRWNTVRCIVGDLASRRLRLDGYDLRPATLRGHLERMRRFRPASLYGYSTAVYLMAAEADPTVDRCPSLKVIALTAETVRPQHRSLVGKAFGVPAVVEYGSCELGAVAFHHADGALRIREEMNLVETVPRVDGRFDLIVTRLNNPSFPLMRYATNDVVASPIIKPDRGMAILGHIEGRQTDVLISREGNIVHSAHVEAILEADDAIRRFQIHQAEDGRVQCFLELVNLSRAADSEHIQKEIQKLLGYPVEVQTVETAPQTSAGKCRYVVSELAAKRLPAL